MNMTPCFISEMPGEKTKALLVGFYQKAWTRDASPLIGGFPAGQMVLSNLYSREANADNYAHFVYCKKCGASGPVITGNEVEPGECRWDKAREAWNKRAQ